MEDLVTISSLKSTSPIEMFINYLDKLQNTEFKIAIINCKKIKEDTKKYLNNHEVEIKEQPHEHCLRKHKHKADGMMKKKNWDLKVESVNKLSMH